MSANAISDSTYTTPPPGSLAHGIWVPTHPDPAKPIDETPRQPAWEHTIERQYHYPQPFLSQPGRSFDTKAEALTLSKHQPSSISPSPSQFTDCKFSSAMLQIASCIALIVLNILGSAGIIPSVTLLFGLNIGIVCLFTLTKLLSEDNQENGKLQKYLMVAFALASLVTNGATFAAASSPALYQLSILGIFGALGACVNSATSQNDQSDT